jgi:hypothetical protein
MRFTHTSLTSLAVVLLSASRASADDKKPAPPPPPPTPAPAMPAPATQVADHAKAMKGTWKCDGSTFAPDGESTPISGTLTMKLDLDKFWAHSTFTGKGKHPYKFESYRTLDPVTGKWHEVMVDNVGGQEVGTSAGPAGYKITWLTDARGPMGSHKGRHTEEISMGGKQLNLSGETSPDGKTWVKAYEAECKH